MGGTSVSHVFCTTSTRLHVCKRVEPGAHLKLPLMPQVSSAHFLLRLGYVIVSSLPNYRAKSSEHVVCGSVLVHSGPAVLFCAVVTVVAQPSPWVFVCLFKCIPFDPPAETHCSSRRHRQLGNFLGGDFNPPLTSCIHVVLMLACFPPPTPPSSSLSFFFLSWHLTSVICVTTLQCKMAEESLLKIGIGLVVGFPISKYL